MVGTMLREILNNVGLVGLVTLPFTIYFFWKKLGHKVAASYSWRVGPLIASGIGTVTLINMKDRPLAIFEIHAEMDNLSFKLKEFDPPLILKAMEAVSVKADIVSKRTLDREVYDWKPPDGKPADVDIFLSTASKTIKCRRQGPPLSRLRFAMKRKLHLIVDETNQFNEVIYNDKAKFAITYTEDKKQKTALIDIGGIIHWDYVANGLRSEDMQSAETVKAAIVARGLAPLISPFVIDDLHERQRPQQSRTYPSPNGQP
jgi:hypothetical protein